MSTPEGEVSLALRIFLFLLCLMTLSRQLYSEDERAMPKLSEYERYMEHVYKVSGHADRRAGFGDYSRGLILPIQRRS